MLAVLLAILTPLFSRWYHFEISRHVAKSVLISTGEDGSYLLRDSANNPGEFTSLSEVRERQYPGRERDGRRVLEEERKGGRD